MAAKSPFLVRERNPDVLTSIANLSNDEVFTPPSFANKMLDTVETAWADTNNGASIWEDKSVKFLDPFTKSGVFLREIVRRLNDGLTKQIPDQQERVNHILANQVFGMAITKLTALTARRSVYCSKLANGKHSIATIFDNEEGSIWFKRTEHSWVGGDRKVITVEKDGKEVEKRLGGKCKHCGAGQSEYERAVDLESHAYALIHTEDPKQLIKEVFGEEMQFDVIIGNPPYQLDDGGYGASAAPIYNKFVNQAKALEPRLMAMVIPARWYSGGRGLQEFRLEMIKDKRIREIHDYPNSDLVFPGVQIKGGVCYFLWDRDNNGSCKISRYGDKGLESIEERPLCEPGASIFLRYSESVPIVKKIIYQEMSGSESSELLALSQDRQFKTLIHSSKPFGLRTFFQGEKLPGAGLLPVYQNGGVGYVPRTLINAGVELIDEWKIYVSRAYGAGNNFPHPIIGKPLIGPPGSVCTETYLAIGPFESEDFAKNALTYMATKFFRFLVFQNKPAQDATRTVYSFVPMQNFSKPWSDEGLKAKYDLSDEETNFIDSIVKPMELDNA
jgi:hypothetical protein